MVLCRICCCPCFSPASIALLNLKLTSRCSCGRFGATIAAVLPRWRLGVWQNRSEPLALACRGLQARLAAGIADAIKCLYFQATPPGWVSLPASCSPGCSQASIWQFSASACCGCVGAKRQRRHHSFAGKPEREAVIVQPGDESAVAHRPVAEPEIIYVTPHQALSSSRCDRACRPAPQIDELFNHSAGGTLDGLDPPAQCRRMNRCVPQTL